jgi:glutamyl-Q tRNA(Asp) synthetase
MIPNLQNIRFSLMHTLYSIPRMQADTEISQQIITRFAPSPTGLLHKGHAYSALKAYHYAQVHNGTFILRIEDIDKVRCKPEFIDAIYEDLHWLGIRWQEPVRVQSHHMHDYQASLNKLRKMGIAYPCFCTRKNIQDEIERAGHAPHGPEGPIYPGICRGLSHEEQSDRIANHDAYAWRLNLEKALKITGDVLHWHDELHGLQTARPHDLGDIVLSRKDTPTSYHLSVITDDALQGVSHIVRGDDLFHATHIHVVLQKLLGLPQPRYIHHPLLTDKAGKRFAKRDKAQTLQSIRASDISATQLIDEIMDQ